jgi:Flp pilus assembly protein TadG
MNTRSVRRAGHRRGKILVLFATILPVLMGLVALAVDTGVIGTARGQMRVGADSAALAGAMQLATNRNAGATPTMIVQARTAATGFMGPNQVLNQAPTVVDNPTNAPNGQIVVGYLSPSDLTSDTPDTTAPATQFNAVKVTAIRDPDHAGIIPTSFASVLGIRGTTMTLSSVAIMQNDTVSGFKCNNGQNANLLPIVLDVDTYTRMLANETTDQYCWDDTTRTVTKPASGVGDGIDESLLYPVDAGDPGNWGTVKIGVSNNSTSVLSAQIRFGITPQQLATYPDSTITCPIQLGGNPGISAGIKDDLASIIGKPVFIPIYDQTGGNGNNAWYHVIKFAGVRILDVNFQGNPKYVIIQPALVKDADAIPGPPETSIGNGGLVRVYLAR